MTALPIDQLTDYSTIVLGSGGEIGFDLTGQVITGIQVIAEWVRRAWYTPTGSLPWAPLVGFDFSSLENTTLDALTLARVKAALEQAAMEVDYVASANVGVTFAARTLTARGRITLVDGRSFPLEVALSQIAGVIRARQLSSLQVSS